MTSGGRPNIPAPRAPQRGIGEWGVHPVGLGCAALSFDLADSPERGADTIRAALDAGVTFLDTALAYTTPTQLNHNEQLIGRVLKGRSAGGSRIVVSTKGGHFRDGDHFGIDARPSTLRRHSELSLRSLDVERIDLYHLHWPDPEVPIAESVGALTELQKAGKIDQIGVSNVGMGELLAAEEVAVIASVQNPFSLFDQSHREVLDHCTDAGIAFLAYSPLRGLSSAAPDVRRRLATVAEARGGSAAQVALAWLLAQSPRLIPVAGSTRPLTARDATAAALLTLSEADLELLATAGH